MEQTIRATTTDRKVNRQQANADGVCSIVSFIDGAMSALTPPRSNSDMTVARKTPNHKIQRLAKSLEKKNEDPE